VFVITKQQHMEGESFNTESSDSKIEHFLTTSRTLIPEPPNPVEFAPVAFCGTSGADLTPSLVPCLECFQGCRWRGFLKAGTGFRRTAAFFATSEDVNLTMSWSFGKRDFQAITWPQLSSGFDRVASALHLSCGTGFHRQRSGFEKPGRPQPFVSTMGFKHRWDFQKSPFGHNHATPKSRQPHLWPHLAFSAHRFSFSARIDAAPL